MNRHLDRQHTRGPPSAGKPSKTPGRVGVGEGEIDDGHSSSGLCVHVCGGASIMGSGGEAALMGEAYKRDGPGW